MKKPDNLRQFLTEALPELAREPDALSIFVTNGTIASRAVPDLSFEYRYTARIVLLDYCGDPAQLFLPLLLWVRANQLELLLNHQKGVEAIKFTVDPVDNKAVDVEIELPLTEAVNVLPDGNGRYAMTIRDEHPVPGTEPLTDPLALLRQIYAPGGMSKELLAGYPEE